MELVRLWRRPVHVGATPIVGEIFAPATILNEFFEQRTNAPRNIFQSDRLLLQTGQSFTGDRTPDIERILARRTPNERDVRVVRSGTTVRTTGHANQNRFLTQTEIFQNVIDFI